MLNKYVMVDKDTGEIVDDQYLSNQAIMMMTKGNQTMPNPTTESLSCISALGDVFNNCQKIDVKLDNALRNVVQTKVIYTKILNALSFGMR